MKLAAAMTQPDEEEMPLLETLCAAAEAEAARRLREGWTPEACEEIFCCAAALLAAAGFLSSRGSSTVESFTAGEVSVRMGGGSGACETAAALRRQAENIMTYYWGDDDFAFVGVKG